MSAERKRVLEMLAEGKITAEDAGKLLDKLEGKAGKASAATESETPGAERPRHLRIQIDRSGQEQVNMRVPLSLMRTGVGLMAVLPPKVHERLAAKGIDLASLRGMKGQELIDALQELHLEVDGPEGKKVRIFCE